jgi:integrase
MCNLVNRCTDRYIRRIFDETEVPMSKPLKDAQLTTASARVKLSRGVHWRALDPDVHLGYRKRVPGGRWVVRWYKGERGYRQATLATADDALPADATNTLNFAQAIKAARKRVVEWRAAELAKASAPAPSVGDAIKDYVKRREARETALQGSGALKRDASTRLAKYVAASKLNARALHTLDVEDLHLWRKELPKHLTVSTVRRLSNDLKAALNSAIRTYRKNLPVGIEAVVRDGLRLEDAHPVEARRQILGDADIRRIIDATGAVDTEEGWDGDLLRLVATLASTGARYSQVIRMTVADVQPNERRLLVPPSRKGRGQKKLERIAVPIGADVIDLLKPVLNGRPGPLPLLERWKVVQVGPSEWRRDRRTSWRSASELQRPWAAILKSAGLPREVLPYALRHSSIVRNLRVGLPTRLVAALHDTSSAMVEKHYSAYIVDAMEELAARAVVPLVNVPTQILPMRRSQT